MSSLNIEKLNYSYNGKPVINDLSLHLNDNEIVCLLGASGCGKTTTLKAIAGLIELSSGVIDISGMRVNDDGTWLAPQKRNIGMMFQDYALFPHLNVAQNIAFGLTDLKNSDKQARVTEMLKLIQLEEFAERFPHQLSGGQQQRVAIARALAYKPSLLLLDEPFSNIDHQVRFQLIEDIRRIIKDQRVSAIFVTHSKEEAYAFSDRLAIMDRGHIAQIGTPEELYCQPQSKVVAEFLSHGIYIDAELQNKRDVVTPLGAISSTQDLDTSIKSGQIYLKPQYLSLNKTDNGQATFISCRFVGTSYLCRITLAEQEIEVPIRDVSHLVQGDKVNIDVLAHPVNFFASE